MLNNINLPKTEAEALALLYRPFSASDHAFHPYHKFCYIKEEAINERLTSVFGLGWSKVILKQEYIPAGVPVVDVGGGVLLSDYSNLTGNQIIPTAKGWSEVVIGQNENGEEVEKFQPLKVIDDIPVVLTHGYIEAHFPVTDIHGNIGYKAARRDSVGADVLTNLGKEPGAKLMNTYKASDTDLLKRCGRQFGIGLYLTELPKDEKIETKEALKGWLKREYGFFDDINEAKRWLAATVAEKIPANQILPMLQANNIPLDTLTWDAHRIATVLLAAAELAAAA